MSNLRWMAALVMTFVLAGGFVVQADTPSPADAALAAVKDYLDQMKAGHAAQAINTYWDADSMLDTICGDDMKQVSPDDRAQMRTELLGIFISKLGTPEVAKVMPATNTMSFSTKSAGASEATVTCTTHIQNQDHVDILPMVRHGDKWQLTDMVSHGDSLMGSFKKLYDSLNHKTKPQEFIKILTSA